MTQEPLYPEGHPKRAEQDSQRINTDAPSPSKKEKKTNRTLHASSEPVIETPENPNDISISDAETQSGDEHAPSDNVNADAHDEAFERFAEMIRPIFLRMRLTDMLKMNPYAKYMKEIVTNKRKIPEAEISTMLANYTFKGGIPRKLGDLGVPTIPCSIKRNYVKTALCDLGAGVSVMPLFIS